MHGLNCESEQVVKNGKITLQDRTSVQKYLCKACGRQFIAVAIKVRTLPLSAPPPWLGGG